MTAPSTPNMGPQSFPARRGAGSVTGGPWQLIEVSGKEVKEATKSIGNSNPGTPLIKVLRSPEVQPGGVPADLQEWSIDGQPPEPEAGWGDEPETRSGPGGRHNNQERWGDEPEEPSDDCFDPQYLTGDWTDNLGHRVLVTRTERRRGERRRRGKGAGKGGRPGYLAVLLKFGMPEKRFNISKDHKAKEWTCGNGVLVRDDSTTDKLVWKAPDGRCSTWERTPPEGPVFFDAPPQMEEDDSQWWNGPMQTQAGGTIYYSSQESWLGPGQGEWKDLNLPPDEEDPSQPPQSGQAAGQEAAWNTGAPEFVMPSAPAVAGTPDLGPASAPSTPSHQPVVMRPQAHAPGTPSLSPAVPPPSGPQALACQLKLSEESPDVLVSGNHLEWSVPDDWGTLKRFPKDFSITSPLFGVQQAANMQLVFYPNGSRTAEAGRCTVALTRGPDSAGIKFQFSVNGRGSGPKVCLGRRYLGDYPKPFDDSEESKTQKVKVSMQVLEVLGISGL